MFNLSNETDYKLLLKTKNYYNFFLLSYYFFYIIFTRLIILSLEQNPTKLKNINTTKLKTLPTIYDLNKNILAYSDYNYSIVNKGTYKHLMRDASISEIQENIYKGNPYINEKILTRKYPYSSITNNMIGHTNIDNQGISLIEKFA